MRAIHISAVLIALAVSGPLALAQSDFAKRFGAEMREQSLRDLARGSPAEQVEAAKHLGVEAAAQTAPVLARHLSDADPAVRLAAALALWTLAGESADAFVAAKPALTAALDDADGAVAMNAAGALTAMKVPEGSLAAARRRVLRDRNVTPYAGFLAARGLIGIDPPVTLVVPLLAYLEQASAPAQRGGSRESVQLARSELERLVDTKDRAILGPIRDQLRVTRSSTVVLLHVLHRFSPRPDGWTDTLLDYTNSPDRDVVSTAWGLLGGQADPASLSRWTPRAAAALAVARSRDDAMHALGSVAGLTAIGLPELAALATSPTATEEQRLRAVRILGDAANTHGPGRNPDVNRKARDLWLATCEPILKTRKLGKDFNTCVDPVTSALPDDKVRARYLAQWLAANNDPGAKVEFLQRLEGMWSAAFDETDTVRAQLANSDPRVTKAAEAALDRIRPAWRESGERQAKKAAGPAPKAAAAPARSGPGADGAALYSAVEVGDVAKVKKLVSGANVLQPVRFPQMTEPPVPLTIALNHCGVPSVTAARLAEIVAYLVSLGADPEGKDAQGANLYDRAKQACPPEVVKALGG